MAGAIPRPRQIVTFDSADLLPERAVGRAVGAGGLLPLLFGLALSLGLSWRLTLLGMASTTPLALGLLEGGRRL